MVSARAFSHARSLTAAAVAVAMMATVAVTAFIPTYSANADQSKDDGAFATSNTIHMGDGSTDVNEADTGLATYVAEISTLARPQTVKPALLMALFTVLGLRKWKVRPSFSASTCSAPKKASSPSAP